MRVFLKANFATVKHGRFKKAENADGTTTIPDEYGEPVLNEKGEVVRENQLPSSAEISTEQTTEEKQIDLQAQIDELQAVLALRQGDDARAAGDAEIKVLEAVEAEKKASEEASDEKVVAEEDAAADEKAQKAAEIQKQIEEEEAKEEEEKPAEPKKGNRGKK